MRSTLVLTVLVVLCATGSALAGDPGPGKMTTVTCKANSAQKYSCYVPKAYAAKKAWPILYCFAPDGNGNAFVQRYRNVCEERGWIVVGSMNSKNGPWGPIKEAMDAMWADCEARFNLSKKMRYASGFSGGARVSFGLGTLKPEHIAGVIAIGAGLSSMNQGRLPDPGLAVWLMCGETDFNRKEIESLKPRLKEAGNPVESRLFPGAHVMPPVPLMEEAVRWMDDQAADRKVERFRQAIDEARKLHEDGDPVAAYLKLVDAQARYAAVKEGRADAKKLRRELERVPEVKTESKALQKYDKAVAWAEKNKDRIEKYPAVRAQAAKRLKDVMSRYPETHAAKLAEKKLSELEGG